jgi:hypothetical protein
MNKEKAKTRRTAAKRAGKGARKAKGAAELREQIETLVKQRAMRLVESAIDEADKGHFAAMKYLFEMIGLYPGPGDGNSNDEEQPQGTESLAKTLLRRLGCPESEDAEVVAGAAAVSDAAAKKLAIEAPVASE